MATERITVNDVYVGDDGGNWADFPNGEEIQLYEFDKCPEGFMPIQVNGEDFTGEAEKLFVKSSDV